MHLVHRFRNFYETSILIRSAIRARNIQILGLVVHLSEILQTITLTIKLTVKPDYFHIEDPTSDSISLTYLAVWRFNPMIDSATKMKYFGWTIGISAAVIGLLTAALIFLI